MKAPRAASSYSMVLLTPARGGSASRSGGGCRDGQRGALIAGEYECLAHAVAAVFSLGHETRAVQTVEPEAVVQAVGDVEVGELFPCEGPPAAVRLAQPDDPAGGDLLLPVAERLPEVTARVDVGGLGQVTEISGRVCCRPPLSERPDPDL